MSKHCCGHTVAIVMTASPSAARLQRIEVVTGVERRRKWSLRRREIVAESLVVGAVVSKVARRHGISLQQLLG